MTVPINQYQRGLRLICTKPHYDGTNFTYLAGIGPSYYGSNLVIQLRSFSLFF